MLDPAPQIFALIAPVSPDQPDFFAQPRQPTSLPDALQQSLRTGLFAHTGRAHQHRQQETLRIGQNELFAPLDFLARVIPDRLAANARRLHALGIDYRSAGEPFSPLLLLALLLALPSQAPLAGRFYQNSVDLLPQASLAPFVEIMVHTLPLRKIVRQAPPRTTLLDHIKYGIEHLAQRARRPAPTLPV